MARLLPILPYLALLWTLVPASAQARTLFVTPTGSGDGSSWASALSSISAALWAADAGDEIWVARGVYAGGHVLSASVSLYGGFAGTETNRAQRRISDNPTILSGGSPILSLYNAGPDTVVSGFVLRDSSGSLESPASGGPGIYIDGGAPVIRDNVITGCRASYTYVCDDTGCYFFPLNLGGGVHAVHSSPVLANNHIQGNQSTVPGGGVSIQGGAPEIAGNWVEGNTSLLVPGLTLGSGGGMACLQAEASISGNLLAWNVADGGDGGGILLVGELASLQDNRFLGNEAAGSGGGAWMESLASDVSLDNNTFTLNRAGNDGGGLWISATSPVQSSVFEGNHAGNRGGGCWAAGGMTVTRSTFRSNAARLGGGMYGAVDRLQSCLFDRNIATVSGGGAANVRQATGNTFAGNIAWRGGAAGLSADAVFANNIVAHNSSGLLGPETESPGVDVRYNLFFENGGRHVLGLPEPSTSAGNFEADPLLAAPADGNLHIQPGSPAVDAGRLVDMDPSVRDIDGQVRPLGPGVDIGADESDGSVWTHEPAVICVRQGGNDTAEGSGWDNARETVQAAIDALPATGGEVWVGPGIFPGQVVLRSGVSILGGFAGVETSRDQRQPAQNTAILDGDRLTVPVIVPDGAVGVRLDGVTIRNGFSVPAWAVPGAGIRCGAAQVEITGCDISDNVLGPGIYSGGGGLGVHGGVVWLRGSTLSRNKASYGAGAFAQSGYLAVLDAAVHDNEAGRDAGGLYAPDLVLGSRISMNSSLEGAGGLRTKGVLAGNVIRLNYGYLGGGLVAEEGAVVAANRVTANSAALDGGGIYASTADLRSNLVAGNTAARNGGGVWAFGGVRMANLTLADNAAVLGGGAYILSTGTPTNIVNCIFASNTSGLYAAPHGNDNDTPQPQFSCFFETPGSDYNVPLNMEGTSFRADPLFADARNGDYRLRPGSPCVDAGDTPSRVTEETDAGGLPRLGGLRVDIGAYEQHIGLYGTADVARILRIAAGILPSTPEDVVRFDVERQGANVRLDVADAVRVARKVAGLEQNP